MPFAALVPGLGEVEVLDHDGPRAVFPAAAMRRLTARGAAVAGGGGPPGQLQRHRERGPGHVPVGRDDRDPEVAGVDVDGRHRVAPEFLQRAGAGGGPSHGPSRYHRPEAGSSVMS